MRDYGMVSPRFWIGETGRKLRKLPDAQRVAMYLLTAPMADMTGVFYCPVATILNDVGAPCEPLAYPSKGLSTSSEGALTPLDRGFEGVKKALLTLQELGFCVYDFESEYVFVKEMARWQIAPKLKPSDNRSKGLRKTVENMPNPMRARFIARYNEDFALGFDEQEVEKMISECGGLISHSEASCKALPSQEQEQEQEQDISSRVSTETLSSANANASESAAENQTDLFDSIEEPQHTLAGKSDAQLAEASAPKNEQTESKPLTDLETDPAPKVAPNPADAHPEIASDAPQIGESGPAEAPATKSDKRNPPVPYQKVVDLYNAKCTPALAAARLTDKRKEDIRKRWKDMQDYTGAKTEEETLAEFGKYFDRISRSDFLKGLKTDFKADFPWLMQRGKIELVFEGRYDKRERNAIDRNGHKGTSPLPDHLNPHLRFDAAYYADAKKPDGTTDWGV